MNSKAPLFDWNSQKWESKNKRMYNQAGKNVWPWFYDKLDSDIEDELDKLNLFSGRALDIGTCSGYQAIGLAKRGFDVVATEISETALADARRNIAASELQDSITLTLDNIADSQLESDAFDIIFDRGCFHSICLFAAEEYVFHIKRIAKITGIVFIKTMSIHEERFVQYDKIGEKNLPMPYRFEKAELEKFFSRHFHSYNIEPSAFFSNTVSPPGLAWLTTLRLK